MWTLEVTCSLQTEVPRSAPAVGWAVGWTQPVIPHGLNGHYFTMHLCLACLLSRAKVAVDNHFPGETRSNSQGTELPTGLSVETVFKPFIDSREFLVWSCRYI